MKLISKNGAIAAIQVIPDEVMPLSGYDLPSLVSAVAERYKFAKSPTIEETNKTGAKFRNGRLIARKISINELAIHNNLISATTTDTSDSEAVVNDLYAWLKEKFGFREPTTKPLRAFQSDLIVEFENGTDKALAAMAPLIDFLQKEHESINGLGKQIQFNRIDFGSDPLVQGPNAVFLIERRAGSAYETNRYFCKAYLPTNAHIRALKLLDKLLGKPKR